MFALNIEISLSVETNQFTDTNFEKLYIILDRFHFECDTSS